MGKIQVKNLTFYYDGSYDTLFEEVSFEIDTNWKIGFIGRNGRGKTTFLKLLQGELEYRGVIESSVIFDYFPFTIRDKNRITIDIIEQLYQEHELWKICKELSLLDVDASVLYRSFDTLSNGEQTKVLLALLFSKEHNFLLIDEPTNHLDNEAREKIAAYLKKKHSFLLVSHDRYFLDCCVDHILALNKSGVEIVQGNFTTWYENKERKDSYEIEENKRLKQDIKRLFKTAKQTAKWADEVEDTKYGNGHVDRGYIGHKAAKMMKRRKSAEMRAQNALEEKKNLLKDIESMDELKICPKRHEKEKIVEADKLSLYYDERKAIDNLSFEVYNGERIALQGKNGCGKSSILKKILGNEIKTSGRISLANGLIISYVSQSTAYLTGDLKDYAKAHKISESLFKALLRKLDFSRVQFDKPIETFSEGQKKKVLIARSLCEQAHLYLWDEPLNYIDIFTRIQIETLLMQFKPTMLFAEHDRKFIEQIATRVIQI